MYYMGTDTGINSTDANSKQTFLLSFHVKVSRLNVT